MDGWMKRTAALMLLMAGCRLGGPAKGDNNGPYFPDPSLGLDSSIASGPDMAVAMRDDHNDAAPIVGAEPPPSGGCGGPFVSAVCDPVCNQGCPSLSRCDISDKPQTGACVGIWISGENEGCVIKGATTDQCAAQLTCLDGKCRRLCYQDADCKTANTCCSESVDVGGVPSGFKVCAPCSI